MRKITVFLLFLILFVASGVFSDEKIDISGTVEWDTLQIKAEVSLDLASAGIKLPFGRTQGESLLNSGYLNLIRPGILDLQVDSSSTVGDLIDRGEFSLQEAETLALRAVSVPPALSPDLKNIRASYTIGLPGVSAVLMRHTRPSPIIRTLNPVSSAQYTGIIIIAYEDLPVYGMKNTALPIPCLFPKIWDSEMKLIYERNMLELSNTAMVGYFPPHSIFQKNPSGLTPELTALVGDRPLRVFAKSVFGAKPTDFIIDNNDAHLIISTEDNRRLLSQGKVAVILDDSVLRHEFSLE